MVIGHLNDYRPWRTTCRVDLFPARNLPHSTSANNDNDTTHRTSSIHQAVALLHLPIQVHFYLVQSVLSGDGPGHDPSNCDSRVSAYISSAVPIISTMAQLVLPLNVLLQTRTTATERLLILLVSPNSSRDSVRTD